MKRILWRYFRITLFLVGLSSGNWLGGSKASAQDLGIRVAIVTRAEYILLSSPTGLLVYNEQAAEPLLTLESEETLALFPTKIYAQRTIQTYRIIASGKEASLASLASRLREGGREVEAIEDQDGECRIVIKGFSTYEEACSLVESFPDEIKSNCEIFTWWEVEKRGEISPVFSNSSEGRVQFKILPRSDNTPFETVLVESGSPKAITRKYRGCARVFITESGRLGLINTVNLEEYLWGVVPAEMSPRFPLEALKAQAVCARSYALSRLGNHEQDGFDLWAQRYDQTYLGVEAENPQTTKAVRETEGLIMHRAGVLIPGFYHTVCGGHTEDVSNVWRGAGSPLKGVWDTPNVPETSLQEEGDCREFLRLDSAAFCKSAPKFRWQREFSKAELEKLFSASLPVLLRNPIDLGGLQSIKVRERTAAGRVRLLEIRGAEGSFFLRGDNIRWAFGNGHVGGRESLPSTFFVIQSDADNYTLIGGGWGHGVGLCQYGAMGMAEAGYDFRSILSHYFGEIELASWQEASRPTLVE